MPTLTSGHTPQNCRVVFLILQTESTNITQGGGISSVAQSVRYQAEKQRVPGSRPSLANLMQGGREEVAVASTRQNIIELAAPTAYQHQLGCKCNDVHPGQAQENISIHVCNQTLTHSVMSIGGHIYSAVKNTLP